MPPTTHILVSIDDPHTATQLCDYLRRFHPDVTQADRTQPLPEQLSGLGPQLLVLAPPAAGVDAAALVRALRLHSLLPLILLTPCADSAARALALECGADDCLSLPVEPRELAARVRNVLRRAQAAAVSGPSEEGNTPASAGLAADPLEPRPAVRAPEAACR